MRKLKKIITAAALAAAMLAGAPRTAAACPYTPGPLGRYIVPAQVLGMYADGDRVQLVVEDNDTPDDYADDRVIDALYCHDCDDVDD